MAFRLVSARQQVARPLSYEGGNAVLPPSSERRVNRDQ